MTKNQSTAVELVKDLAAQPPGTVADCSDPLVMAIAQHHPAIKSLTPVNARREIERLAGQLRFAQKLEATAESDE